MQRIKLLLPAMLLFVATTAYTQQVRLGMTKAEVEALIVQHPEWIRVHKGYVSMEYADDPGVIKDIDHGTFTLNPYEMYDLKGTLTYRLSLQDTVDQLSWRSEYLTFGNDRHTASRAYADMLSSFAKEYGVAEGSQDPNTLTDLARWDIDRGELRLIYDSRFPHIFVSWKADKQRSDY